MSISKKKRRIFVVLILFTLLYTGVVSRLAWIQVIATRAFSPHDVDLVERAVAQRREKLVLNTGRGVIYDRYGVPLTGEEKVGLAVFPLVRYDLEKSGKVDKLAHILGITGEEALRLIKDRKRAGFWENKEGEVIALRPDQARDVQALSIAGVLPLPVTTRYPKDGLAPHLIGYLGQNARLIQEKYMDDVQSGAIRPNSKIGVAGLERSFQPFLAGVGEKSVSYYVDGRGNPLNGLDIRMNETQNEFYPLSVMTTLDSDIQKKVEEAIHESSIQKGAAVVLDVGTKEVLAVASKPDFDPSRPDPATNAWQNLALKQTTPGSIFKVVVAAAALEEGLVKLDEHFVCKGEYGKYGFACWKEGGHGELTFAEAFADSCNITFAEVAKRVGPEKIQLYAKKLGLMQEIGWQKMPFYKLGQFRQLDGEDRGRVFVHDHPLKDEGIVIQTGIGQRDVQMTPLQAANMAAIIAGGGQKQKVKAVQSINYQNGTTFYRFEDRPLDGGTISLETARTLRGLMEGVVDHGTATMLANLPWKAAGKSGTAQTTVNGEARNNQWFVGYVPRDNPRYAIAIMATNQPTKGINEATKLFGDIVTRMAQTEKKTK